MISELLDRAAGRVHLGKVTGSHTGSPLNVYQVTEELSAALAPDSPLVDLLRRARDQLSITGHQPVDDKPNDITVHEMGVSRGLAEEINEFLTKEGL